MSNARLIVLIAGNFFVAISFMSVAGLLNQIMESFQISVSRAGLLIAAFALTAAFSAPLLATAGSRLDRRNLLTASLAICALANLLAAISQTYDQLLAVRVLAALTSAIYTPQVAATVSMLVPERARAPSLAKLMMGWAIGSVAGSPLVILMGTSIGWRAAMGMIGVASGVVALLVYRAVPAGVKVPALNWQRWIGVMRSAPLVLLTLTTGLNSMGHTLLFSYLAPITKALFGLSGTGFAGLNLVAGAGSLAGNLAVMPLMARYGAGRTALASGLLIAITLAVWPLAAASLLMIFILQVLWSLGSGGFPSSQQTRLVMVDPSLAPATIAMNSSIGYLGNSIGTTLGATAWTLVGPRYMAWIALTFVLASLLCSIQGERAERAARQS